MVERQDDYLEGLAADIARIDAGRVEADYDVLERRLDGQAFGSRAGEGLGPASLGGDGVYQSLGNVQSFIGQTNVLIDPAFEQFDGITYGTVENAYGDWRAKYVLNSGTAPTGRTLGSAGTRLDDRNPFNSACLELRLFTFPAGASNTTVYFYPAAGFVAAQTVPLPYLVAACRIGDFGNSINDLTNVTSIALTLEILNGAGAVVASSPSVDFKSLIGSRPFQTQLVTALQETSANFVAGTWLWRLRMDVVGTGTGGSLRVKIGEPQLHYSYSPDPVPFAPQVARWVPSAIKARTGSVGLAQPVVTGRYDGGADDLFVLRADGSMEWGDGTNPADTFLGRDGGGGLSPLVLGATLNVPILSPAQLTANQNDYNPSGLGSAFFIALDANAPRTITGIEAQDSGRILWLFNASAHAITLTSNDTANSTAANCFACPGFVNYVLNGWNSVLLIYNGGLSRWVLAGKT